MIGFRRQCLIASKAARGGNLPETVFAEVFGKHAAVLDGEGRAFYGRAGARQEQKRAKT